jgi:hypothetical protein
MNDIQKLFNSFEGESDTYREIRKEEKRDAARPTWNLLEGIGRLSRDSLGKKTQPSIKTLAAQAEAPSRGHGPSAALLDEKPSGENMREKGVSSVDIPRTAVNVTPDNRPLFSPLPAAAGNEAVDALATVFKRLQKAEPASSESSLRSTFQKLIR